MTDLRARLRAALTEAIRERDAISAGALRSALSAIDNAEAVPPPAAAPSIQGPFAKSAAGLCAAEVPRRALGDAEVIAIVSREVSEREAAAATYESAGRPDSAGRLLAEAAVLRRHLAD